MIKSLIKFLPKDVFFISLLKSDIKAVVLNELSTTKASNGEATKTYKTVF